MKTTATFCTFVHFLYIAWPYPHGTRTKRVAEEMQISSNETLRYLYHYGYLEDMNNMTDAMLTNALMEFQHFIGVAPSGVMDTKTTAMMHKPRCAKPDMVKKRLKRYTFSGNTTWDKPELSFYIDQYTEDLETNAVNSEIQRALDVWSEFTKIQFKPTNDRTSGDINITFCSQDGEGRIVGYADNPTTGVVIFDDDETWTSRKKEGLNLFQVAVHEFGHTLGLGHTDNENAVMYPYYMGYNTNFSLHLDDINGIMSLYKMHNHRSMTQAGNNSILCQNPKINALFAAPDDYIYLLKADKYWKLTSKFNIVEGPKLISSRWPDVPSDVDCAFTGTNNITYFFKGRHVWKYTLDTKAGNSKLISVAFSGIPNDLDAVLTWTGDGKIYFFKGASYWRFDVTKAPNMRVKYTYPHSVRRWNGVPSHIDAAVGIGDSSYFFKYDKVYKYNDLHWRVEYGYPKNVASDLLGCN